MGDTVIRFDGVSKRYRLRRGWYFSIRDEMAALSRRLVTGRATPREAFWALRDVSFEVKRGETVGLIGANGAGKSTTLKILSRVTVPTAGRVEVAGKIGALIEVGAGFHPDLTGRENVFLNGAIMGMRREEIEAKYDRIVAFADIGPFLDTPVKYYSSGMMVRLGFAVAAHVDPEILLVDEVLAVGDAAFQAKCLNRLAELREQARTVVLVSHTMANVLQHSDRVIWIDHGRVQAVGKPDQVVEAYLRSVQASPPEEEALGTARELSPIRITGVRAVDAWGNPTGVLQHGQPAAIEVTWEAAEPVQDPVFTVTFHDMRGWALGGLTTRLDRVKIDTSRGEGTVRLALAPVLFTRGLYTIGAAIQDERIQRYLDVRPGACTFTVEGPGVASREVSGHVVYPHAWEVD